MWLVTIQFLWWWCRRAVRSTNFVRGREVDVDPCLGDEVKIRRSLIVGRDTWTQRWVDAVLGDTMFGHGLATTIARAVAGLGEWPFRIEVQLSTPRSPPDRWCSAEFCSYRQCQKQIQNGTSHSAAKLMASMKTTAMVLTNVDVTCPTWRARCQCLVTTTHHEIYHVVPFMVGGIDYSLMVHA